jgi:hypothetical protein
MSDKLEATNTHIDRGHNTQPVSQSTSQESLGYFQRYRYEPLSSYYVQIRLIYLHRSSNFTSPLQCSIHAWNMTSIAYSYYALSYTWGQPNPEKDKELLVDGSWTLSIRQNLDLALRRVRRRDEDLYIWVDAICINQNDIAEKIIQLPLMGTIYSQAECVLAWIGPDNKNRDGSRCLKRLDDLARHGSFSVDPEFNACLPDDKTEEPPPIVAATSIRAESEPDDLQWQWGFSERATEEDIIMIEQFLKWPYFTRRWIIQEVNLANPYTSGKMMIYCGDTAVDGSVLTNTVRMLYELRGRTDTPSTNPFTSVMKMTRFGDLSPEVFFSPVSWLQDFMGFQCSDPRDHVLSQLGIFEAHNLPPVQNSFQHVSYSSPVSLAYTALGEYQLDCQDMFRGCAAELLHLGCALRRANQSDKVPSWIPDWRNSPKYLVRRFVEPWGYFGPSFTMPSTLYRGIVVERLDKPGLVTDMDGLRSHFGVKYINMDDLALEDLAEYVDVASLEQEVKQGGLYKRSLPRPEFAARWNQTLGCLEIWGLPVDVVQDVIQADPSTRLGRSHLRRAVSVWSCTDYYRIFCGSLFGAVSEAITTHSILLHQSNDTRRRPYFDWLHSHRWSLLDDLDRDESEYETEQFRSYLPKAMTGRSVFRTAAGYVGVCGSEVKPGDQVALILESPVVFVLRSLVHPKCAKDKTSDCTHVSTHILLGPFEAVSDAYIQGFDLPSFGRRYVSPRKLLIW